MNERLSLEQTPELPGLGLSAAARRCLLVLFQMPLACADDLAVATGWSRSHCNRAALELKDAGLADSVAVGWSLRFKVRWRLTPSGCGALWEYGLSWNGEGALGQLLARLPAVEWFYRIAGELEGCGQLLSWQWTLGYPFWAVATYSRGWVAFIWTGGLESEAHLFDEMSRMSAGFDELSPSVGGAWPGLVVVAAGDPWQRDVAMNAAARLGLGGQAGVWCVWDGSRAGVAEMGLSRGWIWAPARDRLQGGWSLESRLEAGFAARSDGVVVSQLLDAVLMWPGVWFSQLAKLVALPRRRIGDSVDWLLAAGWIESDNEGRFHVSTRGLDRLAARDGIHMGGALRRTVRQISSYGERIRDHEEGIIRLCASFAERGGWSAPGWRALHLMQGHQLVPDAVVHLRESPFGIGWHYLEYEKRARSQRRVEDKLRGYLAAERRNDWPLLVVCYNETVEAKFAESGRNLPLATTTLKRVARYGRKNGNDVWRCNGTVVRVG